MAKLAFVSLYFLLFSVSAFHMMRSARGQEKDWCVAKPSSEQVPLSNNIEYACSIVDCSAIQPGGACYLPNNLFNHASVAMNLYYQSRGRNSWNCVFGGTGLRVITDPSYGSCSYNPFGEV
ncbi:major pollen allergen Ole e 10 [Primulina eburnea]|uniref:major pollen allergen Ole e 10 n=1 Tax=Primulina eburnea TaxID=1245227 RepID=UPI003C6C1DB7